MGPNKTKAPGQPDGASDLADVRDRSEEAFRRAMAFHQSGNLAAAERLYRGLLEHSPGHADAHHMLGLVDHQKGHHDRAARNISRAIELSPDRAHYHTNLGEVLRALGQLEQAESSYRRALELAPGHADAMGNLGVVLRAAGRTKEAEDCFRQALTLQPRFPEAAMNLGTLLRDTGRPEEACTAFAQAISANPRLAIAHLSLGNLLLDCDRSDEALPYLEAAVRLRPDLPQTHLGLAAHSMERGRKEEAERHVRRALELDAVNVSALWMLGYVLFMKGEFEEARRVLLSALKLDATNAQVCLTLGNLEVAYGHGDEAVEFFCRAIELAPDLVKAYQSLADARHIGISDHDTMDKLESLAANDRLTVRARASAQFTLAKIHEDHGDFDTAFRHFRTANLTRRRAIRYDPEAHARRVERTIRVFSSQWMDRHAGAGSDSIKPIFVFGMPRSGTTLVEQVVSSHAEVFGGGELENPADIVLTTAGALDDSFLERLATGPDSSEIVGRIASDYLAGLNRLGPDTPRVTDKDPFKFFLLGLMAAAFPHARMIHCRRDPLDVGVSVYFQDFDNSNEYAFDLREIGHYYSQYERLMAHWRELLPGRIFDIEYEQLVADQEQISRSLLDFCGLEWDPRCLEFHANPRGVLTASRWQVRRPLYTDSVKRWKRYARHLDELRRGLGHGGDSPGRHAKV